jgi:hypothetical protein
MTVIPLLLLQKEFVKRHALDLLQFYAQYKSQIPNSRAFNYYFERITMEITDGMGHWRMHDIKSRKQCVEKQLNILKLTT